MNAEHLPNLDDFIDSPETDADGNEPAPVGELVPQLVLPPVPELERLVLPPRPVPKPLPALDLGTHPKSGDAKAAHNAACAQVRQENRTAEKLWEKARNEAAHRVEKGNQERLRAHSILCAQVKAEYQRVKDEYDRYQSGKRRLEAKIEQARRDQNRKAEQSAQRNLRRLERDREKVRQKADTATRAAQRAERMREAGIAVAREKHRLREEEREADEAKKKAYLEKLGRQAAAITEEFGNPFEGLTDEERKQRILDAYFLDEKFYVRGKDGFIVLNASRFEEMLEIHAGYCTTNPRNVTGMPPAKRARNSIQTTRVVQGIGYYTWLPFGRLPKWISGESRIVINIASQRLGAIAATAAWGAEGGFPYLSKALENGFGLHTRDEPHGRLQLDTFLSNMARFVQGAVSGKPRIIAGMIIVGDPDSGKSCLAQWMKLLAGGEAADPWAYFQSGCDSWNDELARAGIWISKDPLVQTEQQRSRVTSAIKQALSDQSFRVKTRWQTAGEVERYQPWIATMNRDAKSRSCIPNGDIADKVNILRFHPALDSRDFQWLKDNPEVLMGELAHFRRFLLDWRTPGYLEGSSRYGVKTFTHPEFSGETLYSAELSEAGDLIAELAKHVSDVMWTGTAQEFLNELEPFMKLHGWDNVKVGRGLTLIFRSHPELVDKKSRCGTFVYHIHLDAYRGSTAAPAPTDAALAPGQEAAERGAA